MNCPKCGAENPDNAYFCGSCGHQMQSAMSQPQGPADLSPEPPPAKPVDTSAPGAGLTPPPAQPAPPPPPAQSAYTPPEPPAQQAAPPQQPYQPPQQQAYQPPQQQPPQQYGPPPGAGYSQPQPGGPYAQQHGNTSGMGEGYEVPQQASGWTFAGFVPFGIYSFVNGSTMWGVIGLVASFLGLYLFYSIFVGIQGKKQAWQGKRFDSVEEFVQTQRGWNIAGVVFLIVGIVFGLMYGCVMSMAMLGAMSEGTY